MEQRVHNRELILVAYANEGPVTDSHLKIRETQLDLGSVGKDGSSGDVAVQNLWISVDPYLRHLMKESDDGLYLPSFRLNQAIRSILVGKVVASANPAFEVGDIVSGFYQVAEYAIVPGGDLRKIDTSVVKPSDYLGILGMPALTAWAGFTIVGEAKPGDEVFVSAAAGSVGMLVGQLAKIKGCRVVGSAGSDQKVKLLKEFGFDDAFNYKSETDLDAALSRYFPRGIDIYFDNVGGRMLEAVLNHINMKARIPVCGMISQYNQEWKQRFGVRNLLNLVGKCAKMEGFMSGQYHHRMGEFFEEMTGYIKQGKIKYKEDVKVGLDSFLEAFNYMFTGENIGKPVIYLGPPPPK
uniref:Phenylpropenal double-bond reductase n=1 Tax=Pinus pinaster TaxID=71647 RepID=G3C9V3_PINPS|nr:phenylpropenal double-bond reductase [Pinus pinaster]